MFNKGEIRIGLNKDDSATYYKSVDCPLVEGKFYKEIDPFADLSLQEVLDFIFFQIAFVMKAVKAVKRETDIPQPFLDAFKGEE